MNNLTDLKQLKFDKEGLIPAIVQSVKTNEVLMLAYMNKEAIDLTLETKMAHYYSRSRKSLWKKGETSGNLQHVKGFYYDCDQDTILLKVDQIGVACHTGAMNCFFNEIYNEEENTFDDNIVEELYDIIKERKANPIEGSYTTYLFTKGIDKILKKVGEETAEIIIGAKNKSKDELVYEVSDLIYHMLVLLVNENIQLEDIRQELKKRRK